MRSQRFCLLECSPRSSISTSGLEKPAGTGTASQRRAYRASLQRAPPQEDSGLQTLRSEGVVPPASRVDPPEEEPEPSLTSEVLDASIESWPGNSSGEDTPELTEDEQAG